MRLATIARSIAVGLLLSTLGLAHADTVDARCDIYPKGSDTASQVVACTFSQRQGHVAIDRADGVRHELSPQGAREPTSTRTASRPTAARAGQHAARSSGWPGSRCSSTGTLPACRGRRRRARLNARPEPLPAAAAPLVPFDRTLKLQGISSASPAPTSVAQQAQDRSAGLAIDNAPIERDIDGTVTGVEVADLNADGSPELYVYVASAGSGSYGSLVAYSANKRKSLSEIYLPPVTDHANAAQGYMGHDEFAVVEGTLVRRFPVYKEGDTNAAPTGGMRQLQYKLRQGEANWVLKLDRVVEY